MNLPNSQSSVSCLHLHRKKYLLKALEYFIHTAYTTTFGVIALMYSSNWIAVFLFVLAGGAFIALCYKLFIAFWPVSNHTGLMLNTSFNKNRRLIALFDEMDRDIATWGKKVGTVWVGKEWMFHDSAVRIADIRGIFMSNSRGLVTRRRGYNILLLDTNRFHSICKVPSAADQKELYDYLVKRIPLAVHGSGFLEFVRLWKSKRAEWESLNKMFIDNVGLQMVAAGESIEVGPQTEFVFQAADGMTTSRITLALMNEAVESLQKDERVMLLLCLPLSTKLGEFLGLECQRKEAEDCYRASLRFEEKWLERSLEITVSLQEMKALFSELFTNHRVSSLSGWELIEVEETEPQAEITLSVDDDRFAYFQFEDVAIALNGLNEGIYREIRLSVVGELKTYMAVTGKENDYTVNLGDLGDVGDPGSSSYFRRHTIYAGYVTNWLASYFCKHEFPELVPEWIDVSKEMRKQERQATPNQQ